MSALPDSLYAPQATPRAGLSALFEPRSIAFIGASDRTNAPATRGLRHCLRLGFAGTLHAVNPKYSQLFGVRCVPSVEALDSPPDLAVIALPAEAALAALLQCQRSGVQAAVLCSSGWGEAGAEGLQREAALRRALADGSLRVLGPNCIGMGSAAARLCVAYNSSFEHLSFRHVRPIGVACQSGAMLGGLLLNAEDSGIGVESYAHVGNGVDISLEEVGAYLLERPAVQALALMIEGLSDAAAFVRLARRARTLGKSIVVFKAGTSDAGIRAVQSHTGALAGSDAIFDAVCRDEDITRVAEPEDLLPVARMLSQGRRPAGRRALVFTLSGGGASALADELERQHIALPALSPVTHALCEALNNPFIRAANPLDAGGSVFSDPNAPAAALAAVADDPGVDAICWIGVGAPRDERSQQLLAGALEVLSAAGKPAVIVPMSGTVAEAGFAPAHEADVPVARSVRAAATLLAAVLPPPAARERTAAGAAAQPAGRVLSEVEAKAELRRFGLPILESVFVEHIDELPAHSARLPFPQVLKAIVPGVTHKTERGLVALSLGNAAEVVSAAQSMFRRNTDVSIIGYTLERQLTDAVETVIGVRVDAQFGPMLMFGLGGTLIELVADVAFTACPCTPESAHRLIARTRAAPLLAGYRGRPPADVDALVRAMVKLAEYGAAEAHRVAEVELNPLLVLPSGQGAYAVDALVALRR